MIQYESAQSLGQRSDKELRLPKDSRDRFVCIWQSLFEAKTFHAECKGKIFIHEFYEWIMENIVESRQFHSSEARFSYGQLNFDCDAITEPSNLISRPR